MASVGTANSAAGVTVATTEKPTQSRSAQAAGARAIQADLKKPTSTTTTTTTTATTVVAGGQVTMELTVAGVDFDSLMANTTIKDAFELSLRTSISTHAGVTVGSVAVALASGSVVVAATIQSNDVHSLTASLTSSQSALTASVVTGLNAVAGISDVVTAGSSLSVSVSALPTAVPTTPAPTPAPPTPATPAPPPISALISHARKAVHAGRWTILSGVMLFAVFPAYTH